jgi:peroxiredoxin
VYCVDNAAVMSAWAVDQKIAGSNISFLGDPNSELTTSLGMTLDNPGPVGKLGPNRCKRFGMYVVDGVVKVIQVSENKGGADDPAGDDFPRTPASTTCSSSSPSSKRQSRMLNDFWR